MRWHSGIQRPTDYWVLTLWQAWHIPKPYEVSIWILLFWRRKLASGNGTSSVQSFRSGDSHYYLIWPPSLAAGTCAMAVGPLGPRHGEDVLLRPRCLACFPEGSGFGFCPQKCMESQDFKLLFYECVVVWQCSWEDSKWLLISAREPTTEESG